MGIEWRGADALPGPGRGGPAGRPDQPGRVSTPRLDAEAAPRQMTRYGFAIGSFAFGREPVDEARRIGDLPFGFGERLALFSGENYGQIVNMIAHQRGPPPEQKAALERAFVPPNEEGVLRRIDRAIDGAHQACGDMSDILSGCRIDHRHELIAAKPLAGDEGTSLKKVGAFQRLESRKGHAAHAEPPLNWMAQS